MSEFGNIRDFKIIFLMMLLLSSSIDVMSQKKNKREQPASVIAATPASARVSAESQREQLKQASLTKNISARSVGPTVMSGRVVDIEVDPKNPHHFFVAYASGGLWVTENNGQSFSPIFDHEAVMTIGDFDVAWNANETIWIGTGEVNSSRSSYSGVGVFKGTKSIIDGVSSWRWENKGLGETHHIGKVLIHPANNDIIWIAALGHLYTSSKDRGVYKSTDGGNTWQQVFYVNETTGCVDLIFDPKNPDELYAATWHRTRTAWNFEGSGAGSGVYQSTDGGKNWKIISHNTAAEKNSNFNETPSQFVGRIGLAMHHSDKGKILYAMLDNQSHRPKESADKKDDELGIKKNDFMNMSKETFLALNDSVLNIFLNRNGFEEGMDAKKIKEMINNDAIKPSAVYDYLYDANEDLFNTPIVGAEVYKFDFSSSKWQRTHEDYLDDVVYTYGYYFGLIRVSPSDPEKLYIAGVPLISSDDGGKSFKGINPDNVHADHHALWINPQLAGHIINGSDGGVQISYDDGQNFVNCNSIPVGQFYTVQVDNAENYNIYGGLQDNGVWYAPHDATIDESWKVTGRNPFMELMGGDGMQVMVDQRDNQTVYTGFQFGNYSRINKNSGEEKGLHVSHKLGERPLRWNWQTPILLSSFNQDILYICSNKVHRSTNQGESFETLSGDLTQGEKLGNVPYGTITCIDESKLRFGLLATGSDDGLVHISKDNGYTWENISAGLPKNLWVSRVQFSSHQLKRIYVTLNGYRQDHFQPYVFVSDDFGITWKNIASNLPIEPVNVIREDPASANILYLGTDHGLYVTISGGKSWMLLSDDLPEVAVHDLAIQHRERDLVVGTHGRSIWIIDLEEITALENLKDSCSFLFNHKPINLRSFGGGWNKWFTQPERHASFAYYSGAESQSASMEIVFGDSLVVRKIDIASVDKGLNYFDYNLTIDEKVIEELENAMNANLKADEEKVNIKKSDNGLYYLPKGEYKIVLKTKDCANKSAPLVIE
jgi:photosystem II stability/assembly factor-like uncharacterized protein